MSNGLELHLNPKIDPEYYAEIYDRDQLVQIPNIFSDEVAEAIEHLLRKSMSWRLVFPEPDPAAPGGDRVVQLTNEDIARMGRDAMSANIREVMTRAADNYGYLYNAYPMIEAYTNNWDSGHPIHTLTEFLNSSEFLDFGRRVIGAESITKADAQATLYARGHFLTRHVDTGFENERQCAYTFGFTQNWQTDWGGLLMMIDDNFDVTRAFLPRFNALSLFDGRAMHAVSPVSPFAGDARFQITGWLRNDPPNIP
jgi:SM-20-related protein